jgi:hypothetical protein
MTLGKRATFSMRVRVGQGPRGVISGSSSWGSVIPVSSPLSALSWVASDDVGVRFVWED